MSVKSEMVEKQKHQKIEILEGEMYKYEIDGITLIVVVKGTSNNYKEVAPVVVLFSSEPLHLHHRLFKITLVQIDKLKPFHGEVIIKSETL